MQLSVKITKLMKVSKRLKKSSKKCKHTTAVTAITPTPPEGAGPVAHGGLNVGGKNGLVVNRLKKYSPLSE